MKNSLRQIIRRAVLAATLAVTVLVAGNLTLAAAPTQQPIVVYPLTNAGTNVFTLSLGAMPLATLTATNINSQPFPIWRGRGFTPNIGFWSTNSGASTLIATFQFATVHASNYLAGAASVTNWSGYGQLVFTAAATGTNENYYWTNVFPTTVDNVSLGRLLTLSNATTSTVWVDPTNSFVGVYP